MIMTTPEDSNLIIQRVRRNGLTREHVFRLWRCAIIDDNELVDEVIQHTYEDMITFDCQRSECVMELMVRRNVAAACALIFPQGGP